VKLVTKGVGSAGYCKLCAFEDPKVQDAFDKRVGAKKGKRYEYSPDALNEWLREKGIGVSASRPTIYAHRKHVMHPNDRIVNAVQRRQAEHGSVPATVSEDEFVDAIIALGNRRAVENPDEVTIDHALKAAQLKANAKKKGNEQAVLVNIFTSGPSTESTIVEGEVKTVS
jgi:hypothetical protein